MDRTDKILILLVVLALAAAVFLAMGRARIEGTNRTVEIIIDVDDACLVASASGKTLPEFLVGLRDAGASALAVRERTVGDLVAEGRIMAMSLRGETSLITPDGSLAVLLVTALRARLPQTEIQMAAPPPVVAVRMPGGDLAEVPALLPVEHVAAAEAVGLDVVARLRNWPGATAAAVEAAVADAVGAGARLIIFDKEEILGYDGLIDITAQAMRENDLLFGRVEMAGQRGDGALAGRLFDRVVRVHSTSESDMLTMTPAVGVPRYARAAQERNIRALYVRLITRAIPEPAARNTEYVKAIASALRADGFHLGSGRPFSAPRGWPPRWPRAVVALGIVAGAILLLRRLVPVSAPWSWGVLLVLLAIGGAISLLALPLLTPLGGLVAAVAFPTLAAVWAVQGVPGVRPRAGRMFLLGAAAYRLVAASAISLAGAMLIVGMYSRVGYLSGIALFTGVKLSLLAPIVLTVAAVIANVSGGIEPMSSWWVRTRVHVAQFLRQPVSVSQVAAVVIVLAAVGFVVTRSGNQPLVLPSLLEVKARELLESALAVRPRTKEFLLGHPALMLSVVLAVRGRRAWLPLVGAIASLGQVSLLNTFCHFHTPLYVSILRALNGLWLGVVLGVILLLIWSAVADRRSLSS